MAKVFDLVVIGSGTAAGNVASRCREAGWTVAMIDKRPFGGTCALRGCDPKKVLVAVAAAVDAARALSGNGVKPGDLAIDWGELMRFKRSFTEPYAAKREADLVATGIETFHGVARFQGASALTVNDVTLEATRAIVIASGARPVDLGINGQEHVATSDDFLDLLSLPESIVFIGGGYISFEFAHVAARAGRRVTILHRGPRPLGGFESDLVDRLIARTVELGVSLQFNAPVSAVTASGDGRRVTFTAEGRDRYIDADLVVHGAGRVPDLDDLDLAAGGVNVTRDGVEVNRHLQSVSNPLVYAAGDCAATDGLPLTPVAGYEGRLVAANLLEGNRKSVDYTALPSVVFTIPPLARVGIGEAEARTQGIRYSVKTGDMSSWNSSRRVGEKCSAFKVLVEDGSSRILGAHLVGPHADETINLFALGMRAGLTADRLKQAFWAYPTHGSDISYMV